MTVWSHLCCWGYAWGAHWMALQHALRGHRVTWFSGCVDLWTGHLGCILCEACPDSSVNDDGEHAGIAIWMRHSYALGWAGARVCGWLGHPELRHPQRYRYGFPAYMHEHWYCYRCLGDVHKESP